MVNGERGNMEKIDRLSSLPDSLLIGILCFLDLKEAVKTAVLSKQWRFLWTDLPRLELKETSEESEKIVNFVCFVNRMIIAVGRRAAALNYFHVEFSYFKRFAWDIDAWVEFAIRNKVENLSLLLDAMDFHELYKLPPAMFSSNSSLTCLSLECCAVVETPTPVEWRCLTRLSLSKVKISQQQLENVVSGCPSLESLELEECWGFHRLSVGSRSFRRLCIDRGGSWSRSDLREISAPYMRELDVSIRRAVKWRVIDATALEQATIRILYNYVLIDPIHFERFFQDIRHVNKLDLLGAHTVEVLSMLVTNGWELPQFSLKELVMHSENNLYISGIIALLKSSPKLEKLVISCKTVSIYWVQNGDELDCDLLHLKSVDITYFGKTMLKLAQIILERAPALVEMVIRNNSSSSTTISDDSIKKFQAHPKSSQKAKVVIIYQ